MSEIEITLPTVQYGNVKIRATPEEFGVDLASPWSVGQMTAVFLNLFTQGFKAGSQMDVMAPQGAAQSEVDRVIEETVKAAQILAEGLGGATEMDEYDSATEAKEAAQARTAGAAPWDRKVDAPAKPWETEVTAPAALDATW